MKWSMKFKDIMLQGMVTPQPGASSDLQKNVEASQPAQSLQPATSYWNPAEAMCSLWIWVKFFWQVSLIIHLRGWNCRLIQRSCSSWRYRPWMICLVVFHNGRYINMVGGIPTRLEKWWSSSMGRITSHILIYIYILWKIIKHVWNHQPVFYQKIWSFHVTSFEDERDWPRWGGQKIEYPNFQMGLSSLSL